MNRPRCITAIVCIIIATQAVGRAQDMDKELADLAEKLSIPIKDHAKKKVTVVDFTDLQGGSSELGKYIAEQLIVNLVIGKRDFAVLDRANLKSILAEHKLTSKGLVDPENAKKLGMFSGVDTLILGTIISKPQTINLTAKIITTDTAEIIGAARAEFKMDDSVKQLLAQPAKPDSLLSAASDGDPQTTAVIASQQFGNLLVSVERLRRSDNGSVVINLIFQNRTDKHSLAAALYHEPCFVQPCSLRASLTAADGTRFQADDSELTGIGSARSGPQAMTELGPGEVRKASIIFYPKGDRANASTTSFTLQAELLVNQNFRTGAYANYRGQNNINSLPPGCRIENMLMEIPVR